MKKQLLSIASKFFSVAPPLESKWITWPKLNTSEDPHIEMIRAAYCGERKKLQKILKEKLININYSVPYSEIVSESMKREIIKSGGSVSDEEITALQAAVIRHQVDTVKVLLEAGADPNEGYPIGSATAQPTKKALKIIKLLALAGAEVNVSTEESMTPLHVAAVEGDLDLVSVIVSRGASMEIENENGDTALDLAIMTASSLDVIDYLLWHGAGVNTGDTLREMTDNPAVIALIEKRIKAASFEKEAMTDEEVDEIWEQV